MALWPAASHASWSRPVTVAPGVPDCTTLCWNPSESGGPWLVEAPDGAAVAVWWRRGQAAGIVDQEVWGAVRPPRRRWQPAVRLTVSAWVGEPLVAIGPTGVAAVAWSGARTFSGPTSVYSSVVHIGHERWAAPQLVPMPAWARPQSLAVDAHGDVALGSGVFEPPAAEERDAEPILQLVVSYRKHNAPGWPAPKVLARAVRIAPRTHRRSTHALGSIAVALDDRGIATARWGESREEVPPEARSGSATRLQVRTRSLAGRWSSLAPGALPPGVEPSDIKLNGRGDAIASVSRTGDAGRTFAFRNKPAGSSRWGPYRFIAGIPWWRDSPGSSLTLDAAGNLLLLLASCDKETGRACTIDAFGVAMTGARTARRRLAANENLFAVSFAANERGDAAALWEKEVARPAEGTESLMLIAALKRAGHRWGRPEQISGTPPHPQSPTIQLDASGEATAMWNSEYGAVEAAETLRTG